MSHLRLTDSVETDAETPPSPGAVKFAAFAPMNDQAALADRKATFVIATGGLMITTTLFLILPLGQFVRAGVWPMLVLALAFSMVCVTLAGIRVAYRCYALAAAGQPDNPLFFQSIAGHSLSSYSAALRAASERQALHDVLDYNYTMAKLGAAKYRLAGRALGCLRVAIPLWMLLLLMLSLRTTW